MGNLHQRGNGITFLIYLYLPFWIFLNRSQEKKTSRHGHCVVMPCSCCYIANRFSSVVVVGTGEITLRTSERKYDTVGLLVFWN